MAGPDGLRDAGEYEENDKEEATVPFGIVEGQVAYAPNAVMTYAADLMCRYDDFSSGDTNEFADSEDPETRWQIGFQAMRAVTDTVKLGGFLSYTGQTAQDLPSDDDYDVWLLGLQGQVDLSPEFILYGQFGFGDKTKGEDDGEGFNDGYVARSGLVYLASPTTAINVDLQLAGMPQYIDNDDPGVFIGFELAGETRVSADLPVFVEYGVRNTIINSTDEGDHVRETEAFVGVSYAFGATTPAEQWRSGVAFGTPDLPGRASAWTEWAD